ncbi:hypothetical protein GFL96_15415 [Rhizobium leguminosarum bv. viciae]|nr:hypothetical protein [Rhizobium leguminosarum bv. viciae]
MRKWIACLTLLCAISSAAGCATTSSWCAANWPIRPTASDVETMSSETARAILSHNEMGAQQCGWKP